MNYGIGEVKGVGDVAGSSRSVVRERPTLGTRHRRSESAKGNGAAPDDKGSLSSTVLYRTLSVEPAES